MNSVHDIATSQTGDCENNELIENKSESSDVTAYDPEIEYPAWLTNMAIDHLCEYDNEGELSDLDFAIGYMTEAISLTPDWNPAFLLRLKQAADMHDFMYARTARVTSLDKAIEYKIRIISLMSHDCSGMPDQLMELGFSLKSRFEHLGKLEDLDEAIETNRKAISLTSQDNSAMHTWLHNIGVLLGDRFERLGELADLNEAIGYKSQALALTPRDHSQIFTRLDSLGSSLQTRFRRLGNLVDLDKAIEYLSQAISLTPPDYYLLHSGLNNLASPFHDRFERLGELTDLDTAIKYYGQAISLTPDGDSAMPVVLNNLACSLDSRFERLGRIVDLNRAIELKNRAVLLTPKDHYELSTWLNNLGASLTVRFQKIGELADLETAIQSFSQAVSLTTEDDASMPTRLTNLGTSLDERYNRLGLRSDLDKEIEYLNQAILLMPQNHSSTPIALHHLCSAYLSRSGLPGMTKDIHLALDCIQRAAESTVGSPFSKFHSALQWARICDRHDHSSLLKAYQRAMLLLPQIVWLGGTVGSRYRHIIDWGDVTTEAAAAAIKMQRYQLALEWLEAGRSIVWKQMLQLRSPIDDLAVVAPSIASTLKQVAMDLNQASTTKSPSQTTLLDALSLEQAAQQHHRLAEKWEGLLEQARLLPGFESFLLPQKASELMRSAQYGPVVVINLDKSSCDALIIRPYADEILHVPLGFSYEQAANTRIQLDQLVRNRNLSSRYFIKEKFKSKDDFGKTLSVLWDEVVKPVLFNLGYIQNNLVDELPHITWCTTGPLSFLPLHAAGDYDSNSMVFNYVVSSYAPTLSALLSPPSATSDFSGILAVGQSSTPGMSPLPGTIAELAQITEKSQGLKVFQLDGDLATPAAVLAGMQEHSWVHLACHAIQNATNPMQSAFYLHGGTLDLATITQKQLGHVELAFLSACQTATGDQSLSEEAVHLAAGMLMVGYRTVIATMWSIGDDDAPLIAEVVYEHLLEGGIPDARKASMAVHQATARLRAKVGLKAFAKWVPYIHIGL